MYLVAVKETGEWYSCKDEIEVARLINRLLTTYPRERLILAEEIELVVADGEVLSLGSLEGEEDN